MAKHTVALVLTIALVLDVVVFFGAGFSLGTLSVSTVNSGGQANYNQVQANAGTSWGDGLSWEVAMPSVSQTGNAPITAMLPGYQSTSVTFQLQIYSTGDCGNTGQPVWAPGNGADWGFYQIQYLQNGNPIPFTGMLNGVSIWSGTGNAYEISLNSSNIIVYCALTSGGGDYFTPGLGWASGPFIKAQNTLSLSGLYPNGQLSISVALMDTRCGGTSAPGFGGTACGVVQSVLPQGVGVDGPNGGSTYVATTTTNVLSAGASISVLNPTTLYNGGTIQVGVTTGYDGANGYALEVICPAPRSCGGQADPQFSGVSNVPNNILAQRVYSISIPSGYATNSTTANWNEISVALVANYGVIAQSQYVPVVISPIYQPQQPTLHYATGSNLLYPSIGDTVTITVWANASATSAAIGSITLQVYYELPGQAATSAPPCGGSYWVTNPCNEKISTVITGNNGQGTFSFTVAPPLGVTQIVVVATGETTTQQGNISNPLIIQIRPAGCTAGTVCDPTSTTASIWYWLGPTLLVTAIALAVALVMLFVPIAVTYRILVIVGTVGVLILIFSTLQSTLFLPGDPLGGNLTSQAAFLLEE